jgi:hypothetical protein
MPLSHRRGHWFDPSIVHRKNNPNDWSIDPRYLVDLLKRIVTVSLETTKIVDGLPSFDILD